MTSLCPTCHDICQVLMIVLIPTEGAVYMSIGRSASHWFLLTHLNVTSYNSGCKDGHITDKVWMLEKKNLKNDSKCGIYDPIFQFKGSTFNIPGEYHGVQGLQHQQRQFSTKHPNYAAVFSSSEREKKPGNFVSAWLPSRIFFSQRRWLFKNQQRIQLHLLCVFAVCVCVIFFDCINTRQSNMTYQLFHGVLLLLHSSHKRRGLLLCGTHILLLVVIIQDAQWRLKGRKDN